MGRCPCCDKTKVKRGPWSPEEDNILRNYIQNFGTGGNWITFPTKAGLKRCGKSCRLRWLNYLRPDIKHGGFTDEENNIIYTLYSKLGSKWSVIASHLPGRTDNDVKNHWNTKLTKKLVSPVSKTNFQETNFEKSTDPIFNFPNPTYFGVLAQETNSDISNLLDQSSPSTANTYTRNYKYNQDIFSSAFPMENYMSHYRYSGVSDLGISINLEMEIIRAMASGNWGQEVISEFGTFDFPNLGNDFYQSIINENLEIED